MSIHEEQLHTLQDGFEENQKELFLFGVGKCAYFTNSIDTKKANTCDNCQRPFEEH